jgi:hypothetical protein
VYGHKPITEEGKYFRNNVWSWGPLAAYIQTVAPDVAGKCRYWHSNDGNGLDAAHALELAARLQAEIDSGRCERFATHTYARIHKDRAFQVQNVRNFDQALNLLPHPHFQVQNVRNFVTFLRGCGGFSIE